MKLKGPLLTAITIIVLLGELLVLGFYSSYPEGSFASPIVTVLTIIAVGVAIWATSFFLILKLRD